MEESAASSRESGAGVRSDAPATASRDRRRSACAADRTRTTRKALRELLSHVSRLARVLRAAGLETPPLELPKSRGHHALRITGRQFARDAKILAAEFTGHGLAPSRIARVTAAFEAAIRDRGTSRNEHIAARTRIHDLLTKASLHVQRLDVIIANVLVTDPVIQAVWTQARRVEDRRRPRTIGATEQMDVAA